MSQQIEIKIAGLNEILRAVERVSIAVSGGVDSMTLAYAAHRQLGKDAAMFHAISPAVPPEATERVQRYAEAYGWTLRIIDAGEFSDQEYLANPVNRCYFCKFNLYGAIRSQSQNPILSGTNLDDLADYRPGLQAAESFGVRHPYVECRIDKAMVREIAKTFELDEMAELPASPCLSSRIETGIRVDALKLRLVHAIEQCVSEKLLAATVRCRIRRNGLVIELDKDVYERFSAGGTGLLRNELEQIGVDHGYIGSFDFAVYKMGSAFLRDQ